MPFDFPRVRARAAAASARSTRSSTGAHPARAAPASCTRSRSSIRWTCCRNWNRLYGRRGFTQYQCVLPDEAGHGRGAALPGAAGRARRGVVPVRDQGLRRRGRGLLSFPQPGISIALDIAVRDDTQALIDALNECVIKEGGRIYLAKDAFTRAEHFRAMEPRLRRVPARCGASGIPTGRSAARSRCACSGRLSSSDLRARRR